MDGNTPKDRYEGPHYDIAGPSSFDEDWGAVSKGGDARSGRYEDLLEFVHQLLLDLLEWLPTEETAGDVKDWLRGDSPFDEEEPGETIPLRLDDGRTLWLRLTSGYARTFVEASPAARAILVLLVVIEALPVDRSAKDANRAWRAARRYVELGRKGLMEPFSLEQLLAARSDPQIAKTPLPELVEAWKLRLHEALLRHYHRDYDSRSDNDKAALLRQADKFATRLWTAAVELQAFYEHGSPDGLSKHRPKPGDTYKGANPEGDVRAAELKDSLGLKHREIAAVLGFPLPEDYHIYGEIPAAKSAIDRGRKLLKQVMSDEEYERRMKSMEPELRRWYEYYRGVIESAARLFREAQGEE